MSIYVIGDVQGCCDALKRLLDHIAFDSGKDQLWFAGDLVNRGPQSAETLRLVMSLGDCAVAVLGNHDLHLLAIAAGGKRGRRDTLNELLAAPDRDELLHWLRQQPLIHRSDEDGGWLMLHAGLPPQWDVAQAETCAREVETMLRGPDADELLERMYGDQPDQWQPDLKNWPRLRFTINCLTRLRYCTADGRLAPEPKGMPGTQASDLMPWFAVPGRRSEQQRIVFGHWSTLGRIHWPEHHVWGLDTGCVWGGQLSALRLEDRQLFAVTCDEQRRPGVEID